MRAIMWIYVCIIFLSETWSLHSGTNENTSLKASTTSPPKKFLVHRNAAFNLGSDAYLNCSDKTWSETMYVIWNIEVNNKSCKIALSNDGEGKNTCNDGKSLRNTSSGQSFLHIPGFSADDVGVYKCESAFKGGSENYDIDVTLTVSPNISAWLKYKDNKMVAVCRAERGNPPANISWSHTGNLETVKTLNDSNGFVTVESYLELPESVTPENLSCIVRHMSWNQEKTLVPELKKDNGLSATYPLWLWIPIPGIIIVFLVGLSLFALKKQIMLRRCRQTGTSTSKSPPTEDVEEVEPYASYVQRVNSIYN